MAVRHVRQGGTGDGSSVENALDSLAAAVRVAKPGDEFVVAGVFSEQFRPPAGTTWVAASGQQAIIDGGWNGRTEPERRGSILVGIGLPDVTIRGFIIRNAPGQGLHVGAGGHNTVIDGCTIHDCEDGAVVVSGEGRNRVKGVRLLNTTMYRLSRSWAVQRNPTNVGGTCRWRWAEDAVVRGCTLYAGYGEGIAAGVGTIGMLVEGNIIHTLMHLALYANWAQNIIFRNNVVFQTGDPLYAQPDGDFGTGIRVGNEFHAKDPSKSENWPAVEHVLVEGNLIVGTGSLFGVANSGKIKNGKWDGYITNIQDLVVTNNTFVAGPHTKLGIVLDENTRGEKVRGRFENNVIVFDRAREGAPPLMHEARGVVLKGNIWTVRPSSLSPDDRVMNADDVLVNPNAAITGAAENHNFNIGNYRPRPGGPLIGADGKALAGALQPAGVEEPDPPPDPDPDPDPEPEPEPEPVDWGGLLDLVAAVAERLAGGGVALDESKMLVSAATSTTQAAFEQISTAYAALDEATEKLNELSLKLDELRERGE